MPETIEALIETGFIKPNSKDNELNSSNDMVKGQINIHYNKYKVNRGLKDEIFK